MPTPEPTLVPELLVADVARSIDFWCSICGFEVRYARPEEEFAYIVHGSAHVMLEQVGVGRNWITDRSKRRLAAASTFKSPCPMLTWSLPRSARPV